MSFHPYFFSLFSRLSSNIISFKKPPRLGQLPLLCVPSALGFPALGLGSPSGFMSLSMTRGRQQTDFHVPEAQLKAEHIVEPQPCLMNWIQPFILLPIFISSPWNWQSIFPAWHYKIGTSVGELRNHKEKRVYLLGDLANQEVHPCLLGLLDPLGETQRKKREKHNGKWRA